MAQAEQCDQGNPHQRGLLDQHDACGIAAVVQIKERFLRGTVTRALSALEALSHRAGRDARGDTGDGAGILTDLPHSLFSACFIKRKMRVPAPLDYAVGMLFLPRDDKKYIGAKEALVSALQKEHIPLLFFRAVPVDERAAGELARQNMPRIEQVFVARPSSIDQGKAFERALFFVRRAFEQRETGAYVCSFSAQRIVYKGLLTAEGLRGFYADLRSMDYKARFALVHARFSTNTAPAWERAHPCRLMAHNGEINTIRGNIDRMLAREATLLDAPELISHRESLSPVIDVRGTDSSMLDNALEVLSMGGLPLPEAVMLTVPPEFEQDAQLDQAVRAMYRAFSARMEPWDGPAALLFAADGYVGAALDRNGLRPARYLITKQDELIISSEVGAPEIAEENILEKGRLTEGGILLCDLQGERVIRDEQVKRLFAQSAPFEALCQAQRPLSALKAENAPDPLPDEQRARLCAAFAYTKEDMQLTLKTLGETGLEPIVSMGADEPLAVLSGAHRPLFDYFYQRFAQVTNPPIDSLREKCMMDTAVFLGREGDVLMASKNDPPSVRLETPLLTVSELETLRALKTPGLCVCTLPILYPVNGDLEGAVNHLLALSDKKIAQGFEILILSDRGVDEGHAAIPALLAVSALEQHLIAIKRRTAVSVVIETGQARDAHQLAALFAFGARAICPYLAYECVRAICESLEAAETYRRGAVAGMVKIAAKMGISSLSAYQSAQLFEIVGLNESTVARYFTNTLSRVGGLTLKELGEDVAFHHERAFLEKSTLENGLHSGQRAGEERLLTPKTIALLRRAVREDRYDLYLEYARETNRLESNGTLRGQLKFVETTPIPLDEVEVEESIITRFRTGAMSYGSLSLEAHACLAKAMNTLGAFSNCGEGGEDEERNGTDSASAVRQIASGRFGVTQEYLLGAKELQIKLAQGAKPGEGGHLPGKKVCPSVAKARHATPGVSLISPPPHHDIYSIEDLAELIYDLKMASAGTPVSVKLASGTGVGTIAAGVAKAGANGVMICGFDGGTGAAALSSIHHAGLPFELGLRQAQEALCESGLRTRVRLEADGKLLSGRDALLSAVLGADNFSFSTLPLLALGCLMCRRCQSNTCPAGIATQDPTLREKFLGEPVHIMRLMRFIAREMREEMARLGVRRVDDLIGRTEYLTRADATGHAALMQVDCLLSSIGRGVHFEKEMPSKHRGTLDARLISLMSDQLLAGEPVTAQVHITNEDRALGAYLSAYVTRRHGASLQKDTVQVTCLGAAGQSFGAFLQQGITLSLQGDSNDYLGKGLCGGRVIQQSIDGAPGLTGNVALYGATSGEAYLCALAGERFAVRNSGAVAVVEGAGAHALEYMTGGEVLILGAVGRNFLSGMSGGTAYVLDERGDLKARLTEKALRVQPPNESQAARIRALLMKHAALTGSRRARALLRDFDAVRFSFLVIVPALYADMLAAIQKEKTAGKTSRQAEMDAFNMLTKE